MIILFNKYLYFFSLSGMDISELNELHRKLDYVTYNNDFTENEQFQQNLTNTNINTTESNLSFTHNKNTNFDFYNNNNNNYNNINETSLYPGVVPKDFEDLESLDMANHFILIF